MQLLQSISEQTSMIIEEQHNITYLESSNKSKDNFLKELTESRRDNNL